MKDTATYTIPERYLEGFMDCYDASWSQEFAQAAILKAMEQSDLEDLDKIKFTKYACKMIESGNYTSQVCYLETRKHGFYFVMRDYADNINVVYYRVV